MGSALQPPLLRAVTKLGTSGTALPEVAALRLGRLYCLIGLLDIGLGAAMIGLHHSIRTFGSGYVLFGIFYAASGLFHLRKHRSLRRASTA